MPCRLAGINNEDASVYAAWGLPVYGFLPRLGIAESRKKGRAFAFPFLFVQAFWLCHKNRVKTRFCGPAGELWLTLGVNLSLQLAAIA